MSKEWIAPTLAVVAALAITYLVVAFLVQLSNAVTLNDVCVENKHHWVANPLTLGATGECRD